MTIVYIVLGVVIGTCIPMPHQRIVRNIASGVWTRLRGWVS